MKLLKLLFCCIALSFSSFWLCQGNDSSTVKILSQQNYQDMYSTESDSDNSLKNKGSHKRKRQKYSNRVHEKYRKHVLPRSKKPLSVKALKNFNDVRKKMQKTVDYALASSKSIKRSVKSYFSSDFEVLLLKMTSPDDNPPDDLDVDRFTATIETFVRNMDVTSVSNPYRVTLRKIWSKLTETDFRTTVKGLYLLHILLRYSQPEDALVFRTLLSKMMRERCSKSKSKYFDITKMCHGSQDRISTSNFISQYATFVLKRAKTFTSSFEEMKLITESMDVDDICAQMFKAKKLIDAALDCKSSLDINHSIGAVIIMCLKCIAIDVKDLFILFYEKLKWIETESINGNLFHVWKKEEVKAMLKHLVEFYDDRYEIITRNLDEINNLLDNQGCDSIDTISHLPKHF